MNFFSGTEFSKFSQSSSKAYTVNWPSTRMDALSSAPKNVTRPPKPRVLGCPARFMMEYVQTATIRSGISGWASFSNSRKLSCKLNLVQPHNETAASRRKPAAGAQVQWRSCERFFVRLVIILLLSERFLSATRQGTAREGTLSDGTWSTGGKRRGWRAGGAGRSADPLGGGSGCVCGSISSGAGDSSSWLMGVGWGAKVPGSSPLGLISG
jgi:hypothetical protein